MNPKSALRIVVFLTLLCVVLAIHQGWMMNHRIFVGDISTSVFEGVEIKTGMAGRYYVGLALHPATAD